MATTKRSRATAAGFCGPANDRCSRPCIHRRPLWHPGRPPMTATSTGRPPDNRRATAERPLDDHRVTSRRPLDDRRTTAGRTPTICKCYLRGEQLAPISVFYTAFTDRRRSCDCRPTVVKQVSGGHSVVVRWSLCSRPAVVRRRPADVAVFGGRPGHLQRSSADARTTATVVGRPAEDRHGRSRSFGGGH